MLQALTLALALVTSPAAPQGLQWTSVTKKSKETISGIVAWDVEGGKTKFLVAHDNKGVDDIKLTWMTSGAGSYKFTKVEISDPRKLASDAEGVPIYKDLESLCRVPGAPGLVAAIGDKDKAQGWVFLFKVNGNKAEITRAFQVPNVLPDSDYEAFDIVKMGDRLVAVWADRGAPNRAAWASAAPFNLNNANPLGSSVRMLLPTPWPQGEAARSVSDLRVTASGDIFVSSASDMGDDGPFDSAVYIVAKLAGTPQTPSLKLYDSPVPVAMTPGYKIEAIDFDPTGKRLLFATDDEFAGASIAWFQR